MVEDKVVDDAIAKIDQIKKQLASSGKTWLV